MNAKQPNSIDIYHRGASTLPAEYLACNQSEPARIEKVKAQAAIRRQKRLAKRAQQHQRTTP